MKTTVESIAYIAEHMKSEMADKKVCVPEVCRKCARSSRRYHLVALLKSINIQIRDDWKYVAMVIDRLLLLIFFGITLGGTLQIILSAPHVFDFVDQEKVIDY